MAIQRDSIHYSTRTIDGYNKSFNFIISEREAGKSTAMWLDKAFKSYKEGRQCLVIRRLINDITDVYINDIASVINKFQDNPITLDYKKGNIKEGVVDVYIVEEGLKKPFIRIIALSNPVSRIKSLIVANIKYIIFDEFICNPKFKEKYLPNEAERFKELFNTFQRETSNLKSYFCGNPYSHYNPYFLWLGVDTSKLKSGVIVSGINWIVECYRICDELRNIILSRNPLYQFDNSYKRYAFDGEAVNDENIKLGTLQNNFRLKFVFYMEGKYIGVYSNNNFDENEDRFFARFLNEVGNKRNIYCFDFEELVNKTCMLSVEERYKFQSLKSAMRNRQISFESIEVFYLLSEIYYNI